MSKVRLFLKRHWLDVCLYLAVLALSVVGFCLLPLFFSSSDAHVLNVNVDGEIVRTVDLSEVEKEENFEVEGAAGPVVIGIRPNAAAILSAPCPEQFCVHQGWVSDGRPVVCAYSHVALLFEANGEFDLST